MAKIVTFMICDAINNIPSPSGEMIPQLVAPQIAVRPQFIPGNYSFSISVGVRDVDLKRVNQIRFTITSPTGVILQDSGNSDFPPTGKPDIIPLEFQGFTLSMDVRNIVIHEEGLYTFSLYINDIVIGTQEIPIFKREEK